jgi:hypothetical protein
MANQLLTQAMITREAVRMFANSNAFLAAVEAGYEADFAFYSWTQWAAEEAAPLISPQLALAAGAAAAVIKNPTVSRRSIFGGW